jgi:signal peptidase I
MSYFDKFKKGKYKNKSFWGKLWYFLWHEDSIESWTINIILAFIIIKFLVYPALGFTLGTSHPIVAVVSGSMEHKLVPEYEYDMVNGEMKKSRTDYYVMCGNRYDEMM